MYNFKISTAFIFDSNRRKFILFLKGQKIIIIPNVDFEIIQFIDDEIE